ncbi:MAG: hypothetical protein LBQ83_01915 [Candidatus Margulisbacteria bacterium]|nr:hypothetical protein [Candidatus Margulisiibacteriota bacterium]
MAMLVWHRRAGKDLFCLQFLAAKAIEKVGNYWFALPEAQQARNAIWEGITADGRRYLDLIPREVVKRLDDHSMKIYFKNGSIISLIGGDRYDKRVGAGLQGAIISEYALHKPSFFDLAIEPMLKETRGFVVFNTTPRGSNHAKDMFEWLNNHDKYFADLKTINDTVDDNGLPIVSEDMLQEERSRGKMEEIIQQEYYCSFSGALVGSYYSDILDQYRQTNYGKFPHDAGYPVHTFWDLGISDSTAIWFVQFINKEIRVIDYYENDGYALGHYVAVLQGKGYLYQTDHIPHDGAHRQMTSGDRALTIEQQLKNLGRRSIKIYPRRNDIYGAIQRTRAILSRVYFNKDTTEAGYEALKQYRRGYDENRQRFKDTPFHDWTSHAADAFSLIAMMEMSGSKISKLKAKKWNGRFF